MGKLLPFSDCPLEFFLPPIDEEAMKEDLTVYLLDYAGALGIKTFDHKIAEEWAVRIMMYLEDDYD